MESTVSSTQKPGYKPIVPALEHTAKLMICLGQNTESNMTLTQICKKIGIHKSKGYSILYTLQQFDFVTKDEMTKQYALGPGLLLLARQVQDDFDIRKISAPYLQNLAHETKSSVLLGIVSHDQFYISDKYEGDETIGITLRYNQPFHITHGAHGKAIAAFMDNHTFNRLLEKGQLFFYGKNNAVDLKVLKKELALCRKKGFAVDHGGVTPGINALSAPIFDQNEKVTAGIVLVGTFSEKYFEPFGKKAADISKTISRKSGAKGKYWA